MAKVCLYARVSKALEQNPQNQLLELRRWANSMEHEVIGEFVDEVSSKDTRPEKEKVLRLLRSGSAQGVAFYALDRWGRSMSELVFELEEFSKAGIIMFSLKEAIDLSSAAGRLFANVLAAMANFERDRIRERTLLGLARAKAQGKKLGRPPKDGRQYRRPSRAEVLPYSRSGKSLREIAKLLGTSKYWVGVKLKELSRSGVDVRVVE